MMRTTIYLDDGILDEVKELTGLNKTSQAIEYALNDYLNRQRQIRLAELGGSLKDENITAPRRRRF